MVLVDSGTFWRCKHGRTGLGSGMAWVDCAECAADDPEAFARFNAPGGVLKVVGPDV
jgi:hypothetical protein